TMMAGFQTLLYRLTGQKDEAEIVVGLPSAGQSASGNQALVGHCVNTLPILTPVRADAPFSEILKAPGKTLLDTFDPPHCTHGSLLQTLRLPRDPSRLPLVSVLFNVDQKLDANKLGFSEGLPEELKVEFFSNPRHFENFELFINCVENSGRLTLEVQYNTD